MLTQRPGWLISPSFLLLVLDNSSVHKCIKLVDYCAECLLVYYLVCNKNSPVYWSYGGITMLFSHILMCTVQRCCLQYEGGVFCWLQSTASPLGVAEFYTLLLNCKGNLPVFTVLFWSVVQLKSCFHFLHLHLPNNFLTLICFLSDWWHFSPSCPPVPFCLSAPFLSTSVQMLF